jgi:5-methylcytosine-specific restriction protein A
VPNLDATFDKGFISFADDGAILISDYLTADVQKTLGIHHKMRITRIEKQHCQYLNYHREYLFKR